MDFYITMPSLKPDGQDFEDSEIQRGKRVGLWIREGLARKNIKKSALAKATGISPTYIGILTNDCYEKRKDRIIRPSPEIIRKIAAALGISPALGMDAAGWKATAEDLQLFPLDDKVLCTFVTTEGVMIEYLSRDEDFKQTVHLALAQAKRRNEGV
jgi:transcriptional regulator with XRE-family HTH domain